MDSELYEDEAAFTEAKSQIQRRIKDLVQMRYHLDRDNVSKWLDRMEGEIIGWRRKDFL